MALEEYVPYFSMYMYVPHSATSVGVRVCERGRERESARVCVLVCPTLARAKSHELVMLVRFHLCAANPQAQWDGNLENKQKKNNFNRTYVLRLNIILLHYEHFMIFSNFNMLYILSEKIFLN